MIRYNGMEAKEASGNVKNLPAGAYVAKVIDAKVEGKEPDQQLKIALDVAEGPYEGFYMKKYQAQKERGSKYGTPTYKGVIRLRIPNPDNKRAMYPESDIRRFNDMLWRFGQSNVGFEPDLADGFDEKILISKFIGISVQEDEYNGAKFTRPARFECVDDVRAGTCQPMPPRQRNEENPTTAPMVDQRSGMEVVNTEKLPWDKDDVPW